MVHYLKVKYDKRKTKSKYIIKNNKVLHSILIIILNQIPIGTCRYKFKRVLWAMTVIEGYINENKEDDFVSIGTTEHNYEFGGKS